MPGHKSLWQLTFCCAFCWVCARAVRHWRYSINIPKAAALYYDIVPVVHYVSLHLLWGYELVEEEDRKSLIRSGYIISVA
jgi:hypothetical protein